jgi:hypothetical protein
MSGCCDDKDDLTVAYLWGKAEANDEIKRLREALRDLLDEQNGPPFVRRADEWQAAVDQARAALGEDK